MLRHPNFLHGRTYPAPGIADIAWFDQSGETIPVEAWNDIEQRTLILRRSMRVPEGKVTILTLLLNPDDRPCDFRLPMPQSARPACCSTAPSPRRSIALCWTTGVRVAAHSAVLLYSRASRMSIRFGATRVGERAHDGVSPVGTGAGGRERGGGSGPILPMTRSPDGWFEAIAPCPDGTRVPLSAGGRNAGARIPPSRAQADDVHDPSVVVDPRRLRVAQHRLARTAVARNRAVRTPCRHPRRISRRGEGASAAGGTRHHRYRADADQRFPGSAQLGLRWRAALCARCRLRHARRAEGAGRCRARPWADDLSRRRVQSLRAGRELPAALRAAILSRRPSDAVGTRDRFPPARGARASSPTTCSTG